MLNSRNTNINVQYFCTLLTKVMSNFSRDFSELEGMQSSVHGIQKFVDHSLKKTQEYITTTINNACSLSFVHSNNALNSSYSNQIVVNTIDCIDNFARSIPFFSTSVAHYQSNSISSAVIAFPMLYSMIFAQKGKGVMYENAHGKRYNVRIKKDVFSTKIVSMGKANELINHNTSKGTEYVVLGSSGYALSMLMLNKVSSCVMQNNNSLESNIAQFFVSEAGNISIKKTDQYIEYIRP